MDVDWIRPCATDEVRDNFDAHVHRGSVLPGTDYACTSGDRVWASAKGIVVLADGNANQVRGRNVIIRHPNGWESHYLHLSRVDVRNGQRVKMHELIGLSGNTGTTSTGAHLHFSVKNRLGVCMDPQILLRDQAREARQEERAEEKKKARRKAKAEEVASEES